MITRRYIINTILSIGISLLLLGLLINGMDGSANPSIRPELLSLLAETSFGFIGLYVATNFIQTFLRALRYGIILQTSGEKVPGKFHLFLVAMSRNMFVDMLPARLGELSYIAMLNRGFKVGADACLSSLVISFVFDLIALALLVLGLIGYQLLFANLQQWIIGIFVMILVISGGILVFLYPFLQWLSRRLALFQWTRNGFLKKIKNLLEDTVISLQQAREGGIVGRVLSLSIGVRIFKYLGLYLLFLGVVLPSFPDMERDISSVFITLVSAEASACLPVPSFMSFGTYEAGGAFALLALGAGKAVSVIIMLALHIWSQIVDYALGIGATVCFIFIVSRGSEFARQEISRRKKNLILVTAVIFIAGILLFAFELRSIKKMGAFRPPRPGQPVLTAGAPRSLNPVLAKLNGFVIWSSNRFGNHDLVMLTLPDQQLTRLTTDPHTEYFPRISPDGTKVVFCRSREPWVSQRNYFAWDVYLFDLHTGDIRLLARNGNVPTWSADGAKVFFQRQGNQFVEHILADGSEKVLFETGRNLPLDASVLLVTPVWSRKRRELAVTLRGGRRGTAVISPERKVRPVADGCELNWSPDSSFLYYVDHGGRGGNAFYRVDPESLQSTLWYDAPGEYSHEYFPKVSNNGEVLVFGASSGGHEHDQADYEIFLWPIGSPPADTARLSFHTGNDNWPDVYLY